MRCPSCMSSSLTSHQLRCPDCHVDPQLAVWKEIRPAYLGVRFLASIVDHVLFIIVSSLIFTLMIKSQLKPSTTAQLLIEVAMYFSYFAFLTGFFGTTPGKAIWKIRVINATSGKKVTMRASVIREFFGRFACLFLSPMGYITVLTKHSRAQTYADIVAHTLVVRKK